MRKTVSRNLYLAAAALLVLSALAVSRRLDTARGETKSAQPTAPSSTVASNSPGDSELAREIDRVVDESGLAQARWGVFVTSMTDGRVIYSRNGDKLFTPAS